jgi:uncharacterized protein (DUF427 family)
MADVMTETVPDQGQRHLAGFYVERTQRRIRVYVSNTVIADSEKALVVFEGGPLATYWLPLADVVHDHVIKADESKSGSTFWEVRVGDRVIEKAAHSLTDPQAERAVLRDHLAFYWNKVDAWFEEDDEVFVEPRNPYHRVDVLHSSRHVRVEINGETVAETTRPSLLFETTLPTRYYIPVQDVRMDRLVPTETTTRCPYKGSASYWSYVNGDVTEKDVVWGYPSPIPECSKIEGLLCFYNERVDIWVDGVLQERPAQRRH